MPVMAKACLACPSLCHYRLYLFILKTIRADMSLSEIIFMAANQQALRIDWISSKTVSRR